MSVPTLGISIKYGTAGSPADTVLAGIVSVDDIPGADFESYSVARVDQTSLLKGKKVTLADGGMLSLTLGPREGEAETFASIYQAVRTLADGNDHSWSVIYSSGDEDDFVGPIKSYKVVSGGSNSELLVKVEIFCNSGSDFTAA